MTERREIAERDQCEIEAEIIVSREGVRLKCLITDLSERGARLQIAEDISLPPIFDLALPIAPDIFDRRAVEVRWQRENMVGLRFLSS